MSMSQYTPTNPIVPSPPEPETPWSSMPAPPEPPAPRRRTGLIAGSIVAVLALGVAAFALVSTQGGGESANAKPLALSFTQGQTATYAIHMTMDGQMSSELFGQMPLQMDMSQVQTWTVRSIDGDGVATIEVTTSELSGVVNNAPLPATAVPPIEIEVAPDGRVISAGGLALGGAGQTQGFGFPGSSQLTPILPDEGDRVAPGDSWEKEFSQEFPFGEGTIEYTASSTYERNEDVNGQQAAVIVTELTVPMDFTLRFDELISALGEDALEGAGPVEIGAIRDATVSYGGQGEFSQTSYVDLEAKEMLRTTGAGDFEISMTFEGIPGFSGGIDFSGSFTQSVERR
jgi:hypothetical protein